MTKYEIRKIAARYPKVVEWSKDDQCYVGRCPLLFSGGIHGDDEAKVYKELCQTAEEWVKLILDDRAQLPKTKTAADFSGKFQVRIDPSLHQRLALKAFSKGVSLNTLVEQALIKD